MQNAELIENHFAAAKPQSGYFCPKIPPEIIRKLPEIILFYPKIIQKIRTFREYFRIKIPGKTRKFLEFCLKYVKIKLNKTLMQV